jgi:hypothetical protein
MSEIIKTIRELPSLLQLTGAAAVDIAEAEKKLGLHFAEEYKAYLSEFGAISAAGTELTGIDEEEYINVVYVTKQGWDLNPQVSHDLYVVEDARIDGILVWQDSKGAIYQSAPHKAAQKIFESLSYYLKSKGKA